MDSELYNYQGFTFSSRYAQTLRHHMPIGLQGRILDAGCSQGATTISLAKKNPLAKILGIDINRDFIDAARSTVAKLAPEHKHNLSFEVADFYELHHAPYGLFDRVIAANNWLLRSYKATQPQQRHALSSLAANLVPQGVLIMSWDGLLIVLQKVEAEQRFALLEDSFSDFGKETSLFRSYKTMIKDATTPGYIANGAGAIALR